MNIKAALHTDRMCKALTGLTVSEFNNLLIDFSWNYFEYEAKRKPDRKRKLGGGRGSYIETSEEKLFYILWYMKTYPTFDLASLKRRFVLPQRKISDPEEYLNYFLKPKKYLQME